MGSSRWREGLGGKGSRRRGHWEGRGLASRVDWEESADGLVEKKATRWLGRERIKKRGGRGRQRIHSI
jgi:hypothetical protein